MDCPRCRVSIEGGDEVKKTEPFPPLVPEPLYDEKEKKFVKVHRPKDGARPKRGVGGREFV